jgi:hypothetical protein
VVSAFRQVEEAAMMNVPNLSAGAEAALSAEAIRKAEENLVSLRARREAVQWRASATLFEEHAPRTEVAEREIVREVAENAARRREARARTTAPPPVQQAKPESLQPPARVYVTATRHSLLPPLRLLEELWTHAWHQTARGVLQ